MSKYSQDRDPLGEIGASVGAAVIFGGFWAIMEGANLVSKWDNAERTRWVYKLEALYEEKTPGVFMGESTVAVFNGIRPEQIGDDLKLVHRKR